MKILLLSLTLVSTLAISGCAWLQATTAKVSTTAKALSADPRVQAVLTDAEKVLGPAAVNSIFTVASDELGGTKVNLGNLLVQSLYTNINNLSSSSSATALIQSQVQAQAPGLVTVVSAKLAKSLNPQAAAALAGVISSAIGAPPAGTSAQAAAAAPSVSAWPSGHFALGHWKSAHRGY